MLKFFIPPVSMLAGWVLVLVSAHAGQATFFALRPALALTLCTSLLSCGYVALRLYPRRAESRIRQAFLLNIVSIVAFFVLALTVLLRMFAV